MFVYGFRYVLVSFVRVFLIVVGRLFIRIRSVLEGIGWVVMVVRVEEFIRVVCVVFRLRGVCDWFLVKVCIWKVLFDY